MTSKALNKYSPAVHNGFWNARSCFKISLVMLLLHLLGMPVVFISTMHNILNHTDSNPSEGALYIAAGATCLAGALGVIIALMNFRYLFSKNQVDMSLSAPLSMKQRFLSDYFSGLASYILPFLAVQILSVILLLVGIIGFDGHEFTIIERDEWIRTYTCTIFSEVLLPAYGRLFFGGILLMIMLYTLTVIITVCCGTLFETIIHTVLINVFIPGFIVTFFMTVFIDRFAVDFVKPFLHILSWTSPAGGLIALGMGLGNENIYDYGSVPIASFAAGVIIFTAALFAGAYFLYKKRRAEQVSKPVVFRGVYAVMITLILFTAELLCFGPDMDEIKKFDKYFFGVLICSFGIYMLFEIVSNRGFKKLWKGAVRYAVTLAVFAVCLTVINTTRCFGMEFKVPSADNVEKVYLSYSGVYYEYPSIDFAYYGGDGFEYGVYVLEDRENIENVIGAHNDIVSSIKEYFDENKDVDDLVNGYWENIFVDTDKSYTSNFLSICYELKNGSRLTRHYSEITAEAVKCLMQVEISEEYKAQAAEMIKEQFYSYEELCKDRAAAAERSEDKDANVYLFVSDPKKAAVYSLNENVRSETLVDEEFYYELRDALAKDIADRTAEEYFTPCSDRMYYMFISGVFYRDIDGSFTETLKVLASHGCLNGVDADIDYILDEDNYIDGTLPKLTIGLQQNMFENGAARALYCQKENISGTDYWNYYATASGRYVIHYSDELAEIFNVMQARYITDEPCYTITVNGNRYTIPPEYSDIAEKVYLSGEDPSGYDENTSFYYGVGAAANN